MEITRKEYLEAVDVIKAYTKQQEKFYKESENLCNKISLFYAREDKKLKEQKISIRLLNCLKSENLEDFTLKELSEKYKKNDLYKFRNFGKKSVQEIDDLITMAGITNWK